MAVMDRLPAQTTPLDHAFPPENLFRYRRAFPQLIHDLADVEPMVVRTTTEEN
jgi:hypothetical protein